MRFYVLILVFIVVLTGIWVTDIDVLLKVVLSSVSVLIIIGLVVIGVSVMRTNLFFYSLCHLDVAERNIAITFDDGPDPVYTPRVLDVLAEYGAKATFFCIGNKIQGNEELLRRIFNEGHSIGNHTYEHAISFPFWTPGRMVQSVIKADNEIKRVIHQETKLFRPPFGVVNNFVAVMISRLHKNSIGWSIRTKDTKFGPTKVLRKVFLNIKPGSVILLHDSHEYIVTELKQILEYCKRHKLKAVALQHS